MVPLFRVASGPTVFSAPMDKRKLRLHFSRPTMAGIEHRHAAVGFFAHGLSGMKSQSGFLKFIIRFGYLAKGAVYLAVGLLALQVAVGFGGETGDTKELSRKSAGAHSGERFW